MDATEVLERQHHHIESLFMEIDFASQLEKEGIFDELMDALALHIHVESAHFVQALQRRDDGLVRQAFAEHDRIRDSAVPLVRIEESRAVGELSGLRATVASHIQWEHDVLIPRAVELIDPGQLELVGEAMSELEVELRERGEPRRELLSTSRASSGPEASPST